MDAQDSGEGSGGGAKPGRRKFGEAVEGENLGGPEIDGSVQRERVEEASIDVQAAVEAHGLHEQGDGAGGGEMAPGDIGSSEDAGLETQQVGDDDGQVDLGAVLRGELLEVFV